MNRYKTLSYIGFLIAITFNSVIAQDFELKSFDESISLLINVDDEISWSATQGNETVIEKTIISLNTNNGKWGKNAKIVSNDVSEMKELLFPVLPQKNSQIANHYKELNLTFEGGYGLHFRVYDEGVAYRFFGTNEGEIEVLSEQMEMTLPEGSYSHFPLEVSMYSHYERDYIVKKIKDIKAKEFASCPVLFSTPSNKRILFSDADLYDYPNAFVAGTSSNALKLIFPKFVLESKPNPLSADRSEIITKEADYIAKTNGNRTFPWRMFALPKADKDLLENEMVFKLSRDRILEDVDWIKAGRVAWDWYNANNIWGVDFKSGITNETYKYYIDFAAKYGIEYIILDEGWTKSTTEILECNPDINVKELVEYGKKKDVEIILWCLWKPLNENMEEILDLYAGWGVKGIKVDFMQRADQYMVNSFTEIAKECAKRKLLVDYHGAYKPAGLRKAYPNVISYEGVRGNENNKWSSAITPKHNTTLPFIRMVAGPMDYTPGAMRNAHLRNHQINFNRPVGLGTRAHEVSKYIIFESAIQMLCDSPSAYLEDKKTVEFISRIPATWNQTIALDAKVGEYVAVARKKDKNWYVGVMNNEEARNIDFDLSFLPKGAYDATIFKDGPNADKYAEDYQVKSMYVSNESTFSIALPGGGGWSLILTPKD